MKNKIESKDKSKKIVEKNKLKEFEIIEKKDTTITVLASKNQIENIKSTAKKYNLKYSEYLIKCHNFYCDYIKNLKNS